jgi:hypothetical protein
MGWIKPMLRGTPGTPQNVNMAAKTSPYKSMARMTAIMAGKPLYRKIDRCKPNAMKMGSAKNTETKVGHMGGPDKGRNTSRRR